MRTGRPRLPDSHFTATCNVCGRDFSYADTRVPRKTCGPECMSEGQRRAGKARPLLRVPTTCRECGSAFYVAPWEVGIRTLCSPECKRQYRINQGRLIAAKASHVPQVEVACENCGVVQTHPPSIAGKRRFCSRACQYAVMRGDNGANAGGGGWMQGERNHNWKGGVGTARKLLYRENPARLSRWRRRVYARDNYTCQRCGVRPTGHNQLRAHHIQPWATHPDLRFDVDNGLTLCHPCHLSEHRR